jgi:hypothetical protein
MAYVEDELLPLGFRPEERNDKRAVLSINHLKLQFDCGCPAYPSIIALGCPIHHPGYPGGSSSVEEAKEIPIALGMRSN